MGNLTNRLAALGQAYLRGKNTWFVNGDLAASGDGSNWDAGFATIQEAVTAASAGDSIFIKQKKITALSTDPVDYAETIIVPNTKPNLALIGVNFGRTQGGLPQIKKGSGSTALLTLRAPGCYISNLCFNGVSSTGGGILIDDDGTTKVAFGTTIENCYFKNCVGSTATDGRTGGAIQWSSAGDGWQTLIQNNRFYKNVADIVLLGTSNSVPQDIVIQNNIFSGPAASVDVNIYMAAGSGVNGLYILNNTFPALPAIGSGSVVRFMDLTACIGVVADNMFGDTTTATGYGAAKAKAKIPTTMFMPRNYNESGLITREA
jgi:hypothetical protein